MKKKMYVTPHCKSVAVNAKQIVCTSVNLTESFGIFYEIEYNNWE